MNQSEIPVLDALEPGPLAHAAASLPSLGPFDELRGLPSQGGQWPAVLEQLRGSPMAPSWHEFFQYLGPYGCEELDRRAARLARQLRENGVTYNVYADEANLQRPWPLDLFPLLITSSDWQAIEAGVLQRVQVLETVMRDTYGERRLLKDGLLPAALVQGHPDYLRAMHGVPVVGGTHLHIVAFDLARTRRNKVSSAEKRNVMKTGVLWNEVVTRVHAESYPDVTLEHVLADNCAMQLVRWPKQYDVIVTDNLFGDVLSDVAAMLTGSLGMLPSASLGAPDAKTKRRKALYEPVHGSAPDIAGKGIANPIAMIASFAMALRYSFGLGDWATKIETAIANVLAQGLRTKDIAAAGEATISTSEMGSAILSELRRA